MVLQYLYRAREIGICTILKIKTITVLMESFPAQSTMEIERQNFGKHICLNYHLQWNLMAILQQQYLKV